MANSFNNTEEILIGKLNVLCGEMTFKILWTLKISCICLI